MKSASPCSHRLEVPQFLTFEHDLEANAGQCEGCIAIDEVAPSSLPLSSFTRSMLLWAVSPFAPYAVLFGGWYFGTALALWCRTWLQKMKPRAPS